MTGPAPYVSIYMTRKQAESALEALRWMAEGRAKSHTLWTVIRRFEEAMEENR